MNKRIARMAKILNDRASRERLSQRRVATCRRLLHAAEAKLSGLHHEQTALRNTTGGQVSATVHWHQQRQRTLTYLDRRIGRIQGIHQQLAQRASRRQAELVNAAQLRRAAQKATTRLQQQANQTTRRSRQRRFDDLVRNVQCSDNPNFNATVT